MAIHRENVRSAASSSTKTPEWIETAARAGYTAKGVTYTIIGGLAFVAAFGHGVRTEGSRGALETLAEQPFGPLLLVTTALCLTGYVLWRAVQATLDPEDEAGDASGKILRAYFAISAVIHAGLVVYALRLAFGERDGSSSSGAEQKASWLLAQPFGRIVLGLIGVAILGASVYQLSKAIRASFRDKLRTSRELTSTQRKLLVRLARAGLGARGLVFAIMGGFALVAAWRANADKVASTGEALRQLQEWSGGPWLLGTVGIGLLGYALLQFAKARFRVISL